MDKGNKILIQKPFRQLPPFKPIQYGDSYGVYFVCACGNAELCLDDKYCDKCLRTLDWSDWNRGERDGKI